MKQVIYLIMERGYMEKHAEPLCAFLDCKKAKFRATHLGQGNAGGQSCNSYYVQKVIVEDSSNVCGEPRNTNKGD